MILGNGNPIITLTEQQGDCFFVEKSFIGRKKKVYIDFIKNDYIDMPECERKKYIDRDKKALAGIIQEKIAQNVMDIVERWYKLSDVGIILQKEKFLDLLKEAEQLFGFGWCYVKI